MEALDKDLANHFEAHDEKLRCAICGSDHHEDYCDQQPEIERLCETCRYYDECSSLTMSDIYPIIPKEGCGLFKSDPELMKPNNSNQ